jgi:hypothetical protein
MAERTNMDLADEVRKDSGPARPFIFEITS